MDVHRFDESYATETVKFQAVKPKQRPEMLHGAEGSCTVGGLFSVQLLPEQQKAKRTSLIFVFWG